MTAFGTFFQYKFERRTAVNARKLVIAKLSILPLEGMLIFV
jgi:hypothetical protein